MGLFSKKHNTNTAANDYSTTSTGAGTGAAGLNNYDDRHAGTTGMTGSSREDYTGLHHDRGTAGLGRHHDDTLGDNTYGSHTGTTGMHTGTTGTTGVGTATDHAGARARGAATSGGGSAKALEGKVERGLGTMLGSATLKAKGMEKEQEAAAIKVQAAHLEQAERLEAEANQHRERAVAYGADHQHAGLGGSANRPSGHNAPIPGEQMVQQPGSMGYGGNPVLPGGGASAGGAAY